MDIRVRAFPDFMIIVPDLRYFDKQVKADSGQLYLFTYVRKPLRKNPNRPDSSTAFHQDRVLIFVFFIWPGKFCINKSQLRLSLASQVHFLRFRHSMDNTVPSDGGETMSISTTQFSSSTPSLQHAPGPDSEVSLSPSSSPPKSPLKSWIVVLTVTSSMMVNVRSFFSQ